VCLETFQRASASASPPTEPATFDLWLLKIAAHVRGERLSSTPEVSFDLLDETPRSEATRTAEGSSLTNPERDLSLWQRNQGCITPAASSEVSLRKLPTFSEEGRQRDAVSIYQTLPEPELPAALLQRIKALVPATPA